MRKRIQQYTIPLIVMVFMSKAAMAEPTISLGGNRYNDADILEEAKFYAYLLGMDENVMMRVNFTAELPKGINGTVEHMPLMENKVQVVILINRRAGRASQMMTLAHEMVHARQLINKELVILDKHHVRWKNGVVYDLRQIAYNDRPWEKEAHELGQRLRRQFLGVKRAAFIL